MTRRLIDDLDVILPVVDLNRTERCFCERIGAHQPLLGLTGCSLSVATLSHHQRVHALDTTEEGRTTGRCNARVLEGGKHMLRPDGCSGRLVALEVVFSDDLLHQSFGDLIQT
ncbi:hypothetical protein D3C85_850200 [compost metagenome]